MMQCDMCGDKQPYATLPKAKDLHERLDLGGPYTDVECPECGALCYPVEEKQEHRDHRVVIRVTGVARGDLEVLPRRIAEALNDLVNPARCDDGLLRLDKVRVKDKGKRK